MFFVEPGYWRCLHDASTLVEQRRGLHTAAGKEEEKSSQFSSVTSSYRAISMIHVFENRHQLLLFVGKIRDLIRVVVLQRKHGSLRDTETSKCTLLLFQNILWVVIFWTCAWVWGSRLGSNPQPEFQWPSRESHFCSHGHRALYPLPCAEWVARDLEEEHVRDRWSVVNLILSSIFLHECVPGTLGKWSMLHP